MAMALMAYHEGCYCRAACPQSILAPMTERNPALDAMIREVESAAAQQPDPIATLAMLLKMVIASAADPYLLTGALV